MGIPANVTFTLHIFADVNVVQSENNEYLKP